MKEGRGAISKAIRELETAGYLQRYQERECGLRREVIYYWHEKALPESKRTRPDKRALPPLTRIR
jgi:DNA-binding MarR family transcriptional regulator